MGEEEPPVTVTAPVVDPKAEAKERLRRPVRKAGTMVAESLFMDEDFQAVMNFWMIRTHILWGVSLALTFIGLNYTLIWLNPPPYEVVATFLPLGLGYLLWQFRRFKKPEPPP